MIKKRLKLIKWRAVIGEDEYGDDFRIDYSEITNQGDIKEVVNTISEQMILSIQRVLFGKNENDLELEKAELDFKNMEGGNQNAG